MENPGTLELLRLYESPNVTYIDPDGSWPIVWKRAKGVYVWDESGRRYLDLTAAFGVAAAGHANPGVIRAGRKQMGELLHAMGDVHPHRRKAELALELSRLTFERWEAGTGKSIFCNSGFEAVEAALKTALLAMGKNGVVAFRGAYHGLGYGALNVTEREHFRSPFRAHLKEFGVFAEFPIEEANLDEVETDLRRMFKERPIGAILVEPVQARGGIRVPPSGFLPLLRKLADENGALLILDEIYTGFGRTGRWFACEHSGTIPDLICVGKALTGGFPLSACVGKAEVIDAAWPRSTGEAIHTSTFLGHPVGCAMALENIKEIEQHDLVRAAETRGKQLLKLLREIGSRDFDVSVRGLGLMMGLELSRSSRPATDAALRVIKSLLHRGFIFLPEGEHSNVIAFTPPLTITARQLKRSVEALAEELSKP